MSSAEPNLEPRSAKEDIDREPDRHKSREASQEKDTRRKRHSVSPSRDRRDRSRDRRDRSRDRRDRSRDHHRRDRPRSRDRHQRRRSRSRGRRDDANRAARRTRDAISKEEEILQQMERTTRTIQAYNLSLRAEERELFEFFSKAGKLADIKIIRDKATGRSKGFAYIEYEKKESIIPALALSGQTILGQSVMVKPSEAEKNAAWEAEQALKRQQKLIESGRGGGIQRQVIAPETRVLASNLHASLGEDHLRPIFEPFGDVISITVQRDAAGQPQGTAIVQYRTAHDAKNAIENLQGEITINGMLMALAPAPADGRPAAPNAAGTGTGTGANTDADQTNGMDEKLDIDAVDGGGLKMTAQSRAALMSKLAANAGIEIPTLMPNTAFGTATGTATGTASVPSNGLELDRGVLGPASPIPTQCLLLKNMFDPAEETAPQWDEDIAADVRDECSKFGRVEFVHVDRESKGFVYVKFNSVEAAAAAQHALHGRWFNLKQLYADFQFTPMFNAHFKL